MKNIFFIICWTTLCPLNAALQDQLALISYTLDSIMQTAERTISSIKDMPETLEAFSPVKARAAIDLELSDATKQFYDAFNKNPKTKAIDEELFPPSGITIPNLTWSCQEANQLKEGFRSLVNDYAGLLEIDPEKQNKMEIVVVSSFPAHSFRSMPLQNSVVIPFEARTLDVASKTGLSLHTLAHYANCDDVSRTCIRAKYCALGETGELQTHAQRICYALMYQTDMKVAALGQQEAAALLETFRQDLLTNGFHDNYQTYPPITNRLLQLARIVAYYRASHP